MKLAIRFDDDSGASVICGVNKDVFRYAGDDLWEQLEFSDVEHFTDWEPATPEPA